MSNHRDSIGRFTKEIVVEPELIWGLYWGNQYSQSEIANFFGCTHGFILKEMRRYGIPARPLSESNKLSINSGKWKSGSLHPDWLGGKSFEPYGIQFNKELKESIRNRDNFTCRECEYTQEQLGYKLSIHHIDYNKRNNNKNNLISLCRVCHSQTNFDRKDWINYYSNLLS